MHKMTEYTDFPIKDFIISWQSHQTRPQSIDETSWISIAIHPRLIRNPVPPCFVPIPFKVDGILTPFNKLNNLRLGTLYPKSLPYPCHNSLVPRLGRRIRRNFLSQNPRKLVHNFPGFLFRGLREIVMESSGKLKSHCTRNEKRETRN